MSNTEKLIKQLNENKEIRKLQEKVVKPAVRIQQVKNNLIILAHDLLVSKKINDSLYRKIQLLTYSKTSEKKLNESYDTLKKLKTTVKKSEQLQGPVKTKKITVTDFKNENKFKKSVKELNETLAKKADKLKNLVSYKGFLNDKQDNIYFRFYNFITDDYLYKVSEEYLKIKNYKIGSNKDYVPIEKTEHTRKKTFVFPFTGNITKILNNYLMNIYKQQKFTFKLTIEFSFLRIKVDDEGFKTKYIGDKNNYITVEFDLRLASTNTRPEGFKNPVVVDNKKDIDKIINKLADLNLIEYFMNESASSEWKFYRFLDVKFHVYEMNTPIGKINQLPIHFKEGSNEKALIKYENYDDYLCFWRCLSYHQMNPKPEDPRNINKKMKQLFNDYYNKEKDIKNYNGVEFVAYDKEYTDEALDNDEYDKKNDEIDLIEKHFNININVYTHDDPESLQIDRRSICNYEDTLNLMRYNNHFMYITNLQQIRHCYRCRKCDKIFKNMEACNRHEKTCDELVKHTFPGGKYDKSKSIFDKIEDLYNDLIKKEKTYIMYHNYKPIVSNDDKYYPYECVFDFEAILKKIESKDETKQLQITSEHVPVSVSIFSNVPEYDVKPTFLCNDKPYKLIDEFITTILNISLKAESINKIKYANIIEFLDAYVNNIQNDLDRFKERNGTPEKYNDKQLKLLSRHENALKNVTSLKTQFDNWYLTLPIVSFNGSKYDINLMKQYLYKSLEDHGETVSFSIKKANSYMSLKTQHLQFLDIRSYLAPNYSYDAFIKAYKCKLEKGFFPYDYFNSYDKINNTELPPHEAFFNKLKNKNITDEEYNVCINAWKDNNMKTFKDFLEWYNNLDVLPFVEAIEKMKEFYKLKRLDIFKDGVSLPGLVLKYLIKSTDSEFYLFDEEDKITKEDRKRNNLFYLLKDSIVGGPSIIFNRYHEANKTYIRGLNKLCKKIIGYDANALYLWAIAQEMPTGKHEHITNYDLNQLKQDILNDNLFGFIKVDIETPEHLKEKFSEMTPIFKNATIKFEDIGEYMQNFHTENNIKFNQGNKLIGSYFGKEIVLYSPLLKWYLQEGLIITKFHCAIQYKPEYAFNKFADEVSDARRAGDVDSAYELIAETMKLFGNSAYGKTITNKEKFVSTSYGNEDNISKKINSPHFKDLEILYGQKYEVTSTKREITMDLPLQIGVAVYHLAKLRMLQFYYNFIDKYIDRSDFQMCQMDTDSNYFAFSEDDIDKIIKPEMREEYERDKINFLPSESEELHPTFQVDGVRFTYKMYDKRKPGLFKIECKKDKLISLCSKMYCASDITEEKIKLSCKGID
jgi:hypothetical protein